VGRDEAAHAENAELLRQLEAKDGALARRAREADDAVAEVLAQTDRQSRECGGASVLS
jgi:hypothetical protein